VETVAASHELARKVCELRKRQRWSYRDLEAKLREHGQPILASGLFKLERGERRTDVDELAALAAVLGVGVLELLGLETTLASAPPAAPARAGPGGMEQATRADLARLGELSPLETTLVETAYRLAGAIDSTSDAKALPGLTKELRATVQELGAGRRRAEKPSGDDDDFGDLDEPD
jgi:transcriptional regulator with XRE-family HTH domain